MPTVWSTCKLLMLLYTKLQFILLVFRSFTKLETFSCFSFIKKNEIGLQYAVKDGQKLIHIVFDCSFQSCAVTLGCLTQEGE